MQHSTLEEHYSYWRLAFRVAAKVRVHLATLTPDDPPAQVSAAMLARVVASAETLTLLVEHAKHDFSSDASMIIRGIYDTMLQGLFVLAKPSERVARAQLLMDYVWIERKMHDEILDSSSTMMARRISQHPRRVAHVPQLRHQYQSLCHQYSTKKKGRIRRAWYPGNLRDLAREVGYESEYEIVQRQLSGVVHSSPLSLTSGAFIDKNDAATFGLWFASRLIGKIAQTYGIEMTQHEVQFVQWAHERVCDQMLDGFDSGASHAPH